MLLLSINPGGPQGGSASQYFIGDFDGKSFSVSKEHDYNSDPLWLDEGFDFYAVTTFHNEPNYLKEKNYKLGIGWLSNWNYANKLPTETWRGMQSFPRELFLKRTQKGYRLFNRFAKEPLESMIKKTFEFKNTKNMTELNSFIKHDVENKESLFLSVIYSLEANKNIPVFGIKLRKSEDEETIIEFRSENSTLVFDRRNSGLTSFADNFAGKNEIIIDLENKKLVLEILVDKCSVEILINEGEKSLSNLIFPKNANSGFEFYGSTEIERVEIGLIDVIEKKLIKNE